MSSVKVGLGNKNGLPVVLFTKVENGANKTSFLHWHKGYRVQLSETVAMDVALEKSTSTLLKSIDGISKFVTENNDKGSQYLPTLVMLGYVINTLATQPDLLVTLRKQEALLDKFIAETCVHHGAPFTKFNSLKEAAAFITNKQPSLTGKLAESNKPLASGVFIQGVDSQFEFEINGAYIKIFNEGTQETFYYETDFFSFANEQVHSQSSLISITVAMDAICNAILFIKGLIPTEEYILTIDQKPVLTRKSTLGFSSLFGN